MRMKSENEKAEKWKREGSCGLNIASAKPRGANSIKFIIQDVGCTSHLRNTALIHACTIVYQCESGSCLSPME